MPADHHKAPSRAASPARKPAAPTEPVTEETPDEAELDTTSEPIPARRQPVRPVRRRRGLARVRRSSAAHYAYDAVKAYIPLLVAFVILFGGVWAWISFGPHTPTPKENWTTIENTWKPKRDHDLQLVASNTTNFSAQQAAYKAVRDDTKGWMDALAAITSWEDPQASPDPNQTTTSDVQAFVSAGDSEAALLDQVVAAKTPNDVLALGDQITQAEATFASAYATARMDIFGASAPSVSPEITLALPSGSLAPSASPGASPGSSASPVATSSPVESASPTTSP